MARERYNVTVRIGRLTLNLSPLKRRDFDAAIEVVRNMKASVYEPFSDTWLKACGDAIGFIFIAARGSHPSLSLVELDEQSETQEIIDAFELLTDASREYLVKMSGEETEDG
jgi:hypothetical protein